MKISIFGSGYVGLVTGTCLSELGNEVLACDTDANKIEILKTGKSPFYEPGLDEMLKRNIEQTRLKFTTDAKQAVEFGEIIFIAVGTPPKANGEADLSFVYQVAESIGKNLVREGVVVVTKSTVPVGTTKEVKRIIEEALAKNSKQLDFYMANNPEFLREGKAIEDFMRPDRVVVGFEKDEAKKIMENLYSPLTKNGHPIFFLDIPSSEMTKYASNTFIAARISLINEIAQLCELVGADVEKVRMAVGSDKRIGQQYIYPGVGYGGSCFPKDVQALSQTGKKHGLNMPVTDAIEETNNKQKTAFAHKIARELKTKNAKKAALWGLAFKPHTDDMRFAPSLEVIEKLLSAGINISAYDPVAMDFAKKILSEKITYAQDMYEALNAADALIIVTEWPQFKEPDFLRIKQLIKSKLIFDGRNIYSQERMRELGFTYHSIGRPRIN